MAWLRERGYIVCKVEQRLNIPGKFITRDAFNFGDLLACHSGGVIALIQVTSTSNLSARVKKIYSLKESQEWIRAGGRIWVHGWSRKGKRGECKKWTLTEKFICEQ